MPAQEEIVHFFPRKRAVISWWDYLLEEGIDGAIRSKVCRPCRSNVKDRFNDVLDGQYVLTDAPLPSGTLIPNLPCAQHFRAFSEFEGISNFS